MNVRSAIAALMLLLPPAAAAVEPGGPAEPDPPTSPLRLNGASAALQDEPKVTIALLPRGTDVEELARVDGLSVGLLSAGLGAVTSDQTYLDIGQGSRLFNSLYPRTAPALFVVDGRVPQQFWQRQVERAEDAPQELIPGLLAGELGRAGIPVTAAESAGSGGLLAVDEDGRVEPTAGCRPGACPGLTVAGTDIAHLDKLVAGLEGDDLVVAIERPPPSNRLLIMGVAGEGFGGMLVSDTTRRDGYASTTDLAPTILERFGIEVPDEMLGSPLGSEGDLDVAEVAGLEERMDQIIPRRGPVIGVSLLVWVALAFLCLAARPQTLGRTALTLLAVSVALLPALLLLTAILGPGREVERLIVLAGAPLLAAAAVALAGPRFGDRAPYLAFAGAGLLSAGGTALDVVAGSAYTPLSLLGSNPGLGVRFFGVGNELEASLSVSLLLACGAGVAAWVRGGDGRRAVAIFTAAVVLAAVVAYAPGRFGADVGAAITLPVGAAVTAIVAVGASKRRAVLLLGAPVAALAALFAIDLAIGGDAHLSRSVLDAGGLDGLADTIERRLRLTSASFENLATSGPFAVAVALLMAGVIARRRIAALLASRPAVRAGFAGALAATAIGTLANDSGAQLMIIGTFILAAFLGLVWAVEGTRPAGDLSQTAPAKDSRPIPGTL